MATRYCTGKDIDWAVAELVRVGWSFKRGRRHGRLRAPCGATVTVPCMPSDRRTLANFTAQTRRARG